jgi:putative endonuclease
MTERDDRHPSRIAAYRLGLAAEDRAAWALRLKGYRILARRARVGSGEIDLVARRGSLVVFAEVKARASLEAALASVSPTAQRRIARAADLWMTGHPELLDLDRRFDIVAVCPGRWPVHVEAAFFPGDWGN